MAVAIICSHFRAEEEEICHFFYLFPFYLPWSDGTGFHDLSFFYYWVLSQLFHSPLSPSSSSFLVSLCFGPLDLRLLILLPTVLIPACNSSSLAFHMMCSTYKSNRQGNNKQPCHTPFSNLNQPAVPCKILMTALDPHTGFSGDR